MARDNGYKDDQTDALLAAILRVPRRRCRRAVVYWHVIHTIITAALVVAVAVLASRIADQNRIIRELDAMLKLVRQAYYDAMQAAQDE